MGLFFVLRVVGAAGRKTFRTGVLLSGGERLGPTEPGGETARRPVVPQRPVDVGSGRTEVKRRPSVLGRRSRSGDRLPSGGLYLLRMKAPAFEQGPTTSGGRRFWADRAGRRDRTTSGGVGSGPTEPAGETDSPTVFVC